MATTLLMPPLPEFRGPRGMVIAAGAALTYPPGGRMGVHQPASCQWHLLSGGVSFA